MRTTSPLAEKFLEAYDCYGAGITLTEFCDQHGFSRRTVSKWRREVRGFAHKMDGMRKDHVKAGIVEESANLATAPARHAEGMPKWQVEFLEGWARSMNRVDTCDKIGVRWAQVAETLKTDEVFRKCYQEVRRENIVRAEDNLMVGAMDGKLSAQVKFLEANSPQYQQKMKHTHKHKGDIKITPNMERDGANIYASLKQVERPKLQAAKQPS